MLLLEFLCVLIATILLVIGFPLIIKPVINSPIHEIKIFFAGMVIVLLSFFFYLLESYYADTNQSISSMINLFDRFGYFFSMIGLLLVGYAFILPNFKTSYTDIFIISEISGLGVSAAFVNGLTSELTISGSYFSTNHNIFGLLLNYLFVMSIFYVIFRRISEVSTISKSISKDHQSNTFLKILFILFFGSFIISALTNVIFPNKVLPSNFYYLFVSLAFAFFIAYYLQDNAFFFLTPISLDAIIITHKKTGLSIYSESYKENFRVEDMLSGVFSLLNVSLQEFIVAKKELEEISFADKTVIIVPGDWISSILILSGKNLIVKTLAKYVTCKFEELFYEELSDNSENKIFDKSKFNGFNLYTKELRQFIPL